MTRYNHEYKHGKVKFYLPEYKINPEESRFLLLKVIEQAIKDYFSLKEKESLNEVFYWETARDFIFDDEYYIQWGDIEINIREALLMLNIDTDFFRETIIEREKNNDRQRESTRNSPRSN